MKTPPKYFLYGDFAAKLSPGRGHSPPAREEKVGGGTRMVVDPPPVVDVTIEIIRFEPHAEES